MDFGEIMLYIVTFVSLYTSFFFFITLLENKNKVTRPAKEKNFPSVCIIVPCYNEEDTVAKTVKSLLVLDYPRDKLDIIVVDDGSRDKTFEIASRFVSQGVRVFKKKNGGKFTALNLGISKTKADFVGALDADSFVDAKALKRIMAYFDNPKIMAVTPSLKVYKPKNWLQKVQWIEYTIGIFLRKIFSFLGSIHVTPGPFSIYRKAFFEKYGNYKSAHLTEDIEVALRIQTNHYQIENAPDAYVYTSSPDSLKSLYYQRKRWYAGFIKNIQDYKHIFSKEYGNLGMLVLPLSFISVFLVIISFAYSVFKSIQGSWRWFWNAYAVNFDIFKFEWKQDLFTINVNAVLILGILSLLTGIIIIMTAKKMASEKAKLAPAYVLYMFTYWALFAFWWGAVFINYLTNKKVSWKHKTDT